MGKTVFSDSKLKEYDLDLTKSVLYDSGFAARKGNALTFPSE